MPVQHLAGVLSGQCSSLAAFRLGRAVQLASCFSLVQCSFLCFLGAHRPSGFRWVCVTSSRELRSTFFEFVNGFIWVQTDNEAIGRTKHCFFNSRLTSVIVSLGHAGSTVILAAQLSFVNFVLREEFAFLFQTFSRNDLPGEAPLSRGRSVFKKEKEKKGKMGVIRPLRAKKK